MHDHLYPDDLERRREAAVDRYILAFDRGDLDTVADVLAQAVDDPELDRRLIGVNTALHAEAGLQSHEDQARVVRRLAYRYVPSGIPSDDEPPRPVTVGEVASHLKADHARGRSLPPGDAAANERLLASGIPVSTPVTADVVARLVDGLGFVASDRYRELFRRAAVTLAMARQRDRTLRIAARRQTTPQPRAGHGSGRKPAKGEREEEP